MSSVREKIEKRAFELFLQRGGQHGYAIEDWLKAEREILSQEDKKSFKPAAAKPVYKKR